VPCQRAQQCRCVIVHPDHVIRRKAAAMRHESWTQLRRHDERGAASGIDAAVRIRPMCQRQLDERAVAAPIDGYGAQRPEEAPERPAYTGALERLLEKAFS